jgi:hypothetical protein
MYNPIISKRSSVVFFPLISRYTEPDQIQNDEDSDDKSGNTLQNEGEDDAYGRNSARGSRHESQKTASARGSDPVQERNAEENLKSSAAKTVKSQTVSNGMSPGMRRNGNSFTNMSQATMSPGPRSTAKSFASRRTDKTV